MHPGQLPAIHITNSTHSDLDFIFSLFDAAITYQQKNNYNLWPQFSRELIGTEIAEKRHWKVVQENVIVCVFSVMYSDPVIWGEESNAEPSVYLHRIAVNPLFKGRGIMNVIRDWALEHAKQNNKQYLRMDTWGDNLPLRQYYISCGFDYLGQQYLKEVSGLPAHYGGLVLSLFQIKVS